MEGENCFCRSLAGYAANIAYGRGNLFFMIIPVVANVRFPPAESPAITIFLGLMLKYLLMLFTRN